MKQFISLLRAQLSRWCYPPSAHWLATRSIHPLSRRFGFDRGTPIDRYWIEAFLAAHRNQITGRVLEITDTHYTRLFGHGVTVADALDLNSRNRRANLHGDLRDLQKLIPSHTYDCLILTHVLGMIDDYNAALRECQRILKPGGTLLLTSSCFAPLTSGLHSNYWRLTPASAQYVLGHHFRQVQVTSYGNVLTGQAFWVGLAQEELTPAELEYNDPHYPCIVGAVCHT